MVGGSDKQLRFFDVKGDVTSCEMKLYTPGFIDDKTNKSFDCVKLKDPVNVAAFTGDGAVVAAAGGTSTESTVMIFATEWKASAHVTLSKAGASLDFSGAILALCFSGDGTVLAIGGKAQEVTLYMLDPNNQTSAPVRRGKIQCGREIWYAPH